MGPAENGPTLTRRRPDTSGSTVTTAVAATPATARRATPQGTVGARAGLLLFVGSIALCLVKGAGVVQYAYPLLTAGLAVTYLLRREWLPYLAFTVVTWLLAPELRRIADWQSSYHSQSLISLAPSIVSLLALPWALRGRRRVYRDVAGLVVVTLLVMVYGFAIGVLTNGTAAALVDILYLTAPMVTGVFVLMVVPDDVSIASMLRALAFWGCLGLGAYGLLQFLVLPPWDLRWLIDSAVSNLGDPAPGQFRVFSTLSTTGPLGQVLAGLLLLLVAEPRFRRQLVAGGFGLVALGATLVRAGWIGLALGMAALLLMGRSRVVRMGAVVMLLLAGLVIVGGPVLDRVSARASRTASSNTEDISLNARIEFQSEIAPKVLSDPVGLGMGSTGRAVDVGSSAFTDPKYHNFDSGIFETLTRYGAVGGLAVLVAMTVACAGVLRRARRGSLLDAATAAALLALMTGMVFTDTNRGAYGLLTWLLLGAAGRVPVRQRVEAT